MLLTKFKNFFQRSMRLLLTALICTLLVFSSVLPAMAANDSSPQKGEANLNKIQKETDDVAKNNPRSAEELSEKAKQGSNAVQGSADIEQMKRPGETGATSVEEKANELLQGLTN